MGEGDEERKRKKRGRKGRMKEEEESEEDKELGRSKGCRRMRRGCGWGEQQVRRT